MSGLTPHPFRHEALFYAGEEQFMAGTVPFIRDAVGNEEPILVAVSAARTQTLRAELDGAAESVHFLDMEKMGKNPARIIPAWRDFVQEHTDAGRPLRGIGEPIWKGRSEAELVECHHHESLLNLAFCDVLDFWLLCPYDVDALDADVVVEAKRNHPFIANGDASRRSHAYVGPDQTGGPYDGELPAPAARPAEFAFGTGGLRAVRRFIARHASAAGLAQGRTADLTLAVSELATNSLIHGGGDGTVRVWREEGALLCEVRDRGQLRHPLLGRERPTPDQLSGRGLWLVNHLCDLVQMRSRPAGNVVRLHMSLR